MKQWIMSLSLSMMMGVGLMGCASNRQAIKDTRELIDKSRHVDCETIRQYIELIDKELAKQQ